MQILKALCTVVAVLVVPLAAAIAQPPVHTCGSDVVRRIDVAEAAARTSEMHPDLARIARSERAAAKLQSNPEVVGFWILDYSSQQFRRLDAVRYHIGNRARLWIDVADTGRSTVMSRVSVVIDALERATAAGSRDSLRGIIQNVSDVFGAVPSRFGDTVVDFLLFDIPESSIAGYFSPWDQTTEMYSNQRNLLYIDSREGLSNTSSLLNTIAHEFQHLIHFGINEYSDIFINEGCSEVAGLLCGYPDRTNIEYLRNTNWNLFDFPEDLNARNVAYERAFTVMWYLYEQFGESFLRAIPESRNAGMPVLEEAMAAARGAGDSATWSIVGRTFAVANYLQASDNPHYGYRRRITNRLQPRARATRTYDPGAMLPRDSVVLQPYGAAYFTYDQPGIIRISASGRYSFAATALCYTGSAVEIIEVEPGRVTELGSGAGYDRIVLVFNELSNAVQKVVWTSQTVLGAPADAPTAPVARLDVRPIPLRDHGTLVYHVPAASAVTIDLLTLDGTRVRTLSEASRQEPGTHRLDLDVAGLQSGAYIVRARIGAATIVRLLPFVN